MIKKCLRNLSKEIFEDKKREHLTNICECTTCLFNRQYFDAHVSGITSKFFLKEREREIKRTSYFKKSCLKCLCEYINFNTSQLNTSLYLGRNVHPEQARCQGHCSGNGRSPSDSRNVPHTDSCLYIR